MIFLVEGAYAPGSQIEFPHAYDTTFIMHSNLDVVLSCIIVLVSM